MRREDRQAILKFIEDLGLKKNVSFSEMLSCVKDKQFVFNQRFFKGWTFRKIAESIGVTSARAGGIYREMIDRAMAHMYLYDKKTEFEESGKAHDLEIIWLPVSQKLKTVASDCTFLHELTQFTEQSFLERRGCGKKTLYEAIRWLALFRMKFK